MEVFAGTGVLFGFVCFCTASSSSRIESRESLITARCVVCVCACVCGVICPFFENPPGGALYLILRQKKKPLWSVLKERWRGIAWGPGAALRIITIFSSKEHPQVVFSRGRGAIFLQRTHRPGAKRSPRRVVSCISPACKNTQNNNNTRKRENTGIYTYSSAVVLEPTMPGLRKQHLSRRNHSTRRAEEGRLGRLAPFAALPGGNDPSFPRYYHRRRRQSIPFIIICERTPRRGCPRNSTRKITPGRTRTRIQRGCR